MNTPTTASLPLGGLVDQVHLHREVLALDSVLARIVEVVLDQRVAVVGDGQRVAAFVVDLDGVAVVDAVGHVLVVRDAERAGGNSVFSRRVSLPGPCRRCRWATATGPRRRRRTSG